MISAAGASGKLRDYRVPAVPTRPQESGIIKKQLLLPCIKALLYLSPLFPPSRES